MRTDMTGFVTGILALTLTNCLVVLSASSFSKDYMTEQCNERLAGRLSGRLETAPSLTYDNNMDCYTTISVADDRRIFVIVRRFDIEAKVGGVCVDAVDVYDARTTAGLMLYEKACGVHLVHNFTTSANHLTVQFVSDANAVYRGFDFLYTAYYDPPCDVGDFLCSTGMCIDGSLRCDEEGQCGDGSDEALCAVLEDDKDGSRLGLIIGCSVAGFILLVVLVVIGVKVYDYYKWRHWLRRNAADDPALDAHAWNYEYPVTDLYLKEIVGEHGRRTPTYGVLTNEE